MKTLRFKQPHAALLAGILSTLSFPAFSQEIVQAAPAVTTTETVASDGTTTTGTISEFGPDRIVIRSSTAEAPVRYSFSKTTRYVDEAGSPVSIETVKSGLPVTIQYTKVGDQMVASKVVVKKTVTTQSSPAEAQTTTSTTTTKGTVSDFGPERFTVRTESSSSPVQYAYSKTTTYVDEAGQPVSLEMVKSGAPVTVYYTKTGDGMVASKVIVRKKTTTTTTEAPAPPPAPVIEEKTTTTKTVR